MLRCSILGCLTLTALCLAALAGCDDGPTIVTRPDSGPRIDAGTPPDSGIVFDASTADAGDVDAGEELDAGEETDANVEEDGGIEASGFEGWGFGDAFACSAANPTPVRGCVGNEDCDPGELCATGGCAGRFCLRAGAECGGDGDCGDGQRCENGVCRGIGPGCVDDRACPPGFRCTPDGECQDGRLPCVDFAGCPPTMTCQLRSDLGAGHRWCEPTLRGCDLGTPSSCPDRCLDPGTGDALCYPDSGDCSTHGECVAEDGAGSRCAVDIVTGDRACSFEGPCLSETDCASGYLCVDAHLDGSLACQAPSLDCTNLLDCPDNSLCFDHDEDGEALCICFDPLTSTPLPCTLL